MHAWSCSPAGSDAIDETVGALQALGSPEAFGLPTDLTEAGAVEAAFAQVDERWGELNVLVNAAGPVDVGIGGFEALDDDEWLATMDIGLLAAVRCVRAALPLLRRAEWARIVNVSAHSTKRQSSALPAYTAAKAALTSVSKNLSLSLAPEGILVNTVSPGSFASRGLRDYVAALPPERHADPDDLVDVMRVIEEDFGHPAHLATSRRPIRDRAGHRVRGLAGQQLHDRSRHQRRRRVGLHVSTPKVEVHLFLPQMRMTMDALVERAQAAEAAGFDGIALMDHLAPPMAEDQPMFEAMTTATWLAARTERLTIGHLVLCDALRHPVVLARQAVTIDHASGGRFELGIGWGSVPEELEAFGVFDTSPRVRVDRLAETLQVLELLWSGDEVSFDGQFFSLDAVQNQPVPTAAHPGRDRRHRPAHARPGGPPRRTGGTCPSTARRPGDHAGTGRAAAGVGAADGRRSSPTRAAGTR